MVILNGVISPKPLSISESVNHFIARKTMHINPPVKYCRPATNQCSVIIKKDGFVYNYSDKMLRYSLN